MIPILSIDQLRQLDQKAHSQGRLEELVNNAGRQVYVAALKILKGTYGRRVFVIAGRGNNGKDAMVAAKLLRDRGAKVVEVEADKCDLVPRDFELVIDGAYGTGFHGTYSRPRLQGNPYVISIDIPSGVNGDTGVACDGAIKADATVTFASLKAGLLIGDGPNLAGHISVADIGLEIDACNTWLLEESDCIGNINFGKRSDNKWSYPVAVLSARPGMEGATHLASSSAMHAGAGMVRILCRSGTSERLPVSEAVIVEYPNENYVDEVGVESQRCKAMVVGPGFGLSEEAKLQLRSIIATSTCPLVIDADAISAFSNAQDLREVLKCQPRREVVITPHDGEFERLVGRKPLPDRISDVRELAQRLGCSVLLKGPASIVASSSGEVYVSNSGTKVLATAGSGDVLAGLIASLIARGCNTFQAAAYGTFIHGKSARQLGSYAITASALPSAIAKWFERGEH